MVGGGSVGTRKAAALHAAGARVRVISREVSSELATLAEDDSRLYIERKSYEGPEDIGDAAVVIAATDSSDTNASIATDACSMHRLVSVVDAPDSGSFVSMAVHRAGPLIIGVSASNVPTAAVRIRDAIAGRFDERYAEAVTACAALRSDVLETRGAKEWAKVHPALIGPDFCDQVENATFSEELAACRS